MHFICYADSTPGFSRRPARLAVALVDAGLTSQANLVVALRLQTRLLRVYPQQINESH